MTDKLLVPSRSLPVSKRSTMASFIGVVCTSSWKRRVSWLEAVRRADLAVVFHTGKVYKSDERWARLARWNSCEVWGYNTELYAYRRWCTTPKHARGKDEEWLKP